jgi:hypothetical protein
LDSQLFDCAADIVGEEEAVVDAVASRENVHVKEGVIDTLEDGVGPERDIDFVADTADDSEVLTDQDRESV